MFCGTTAYFSRNYSTNGNGKEQQESSLRSKIAEAYAKRSKYALEQINKANTKYENFVGLSDVQEAQRKVKEVTGNMFEIVLETSRVLN